MIFEISFELPWAAAVDMARAATTLAAAEELAVVRSRQGIGANYQGQSGGIYLEGQAPKIRRLGFRNLVIVFPWW